AAVFGILGHLMDSAPTMLAALEHVCKYLRTVSNIYEYRLETSGEEVFFFLEPIPEWNARSPETARMSVDFSFAGFVQSMGRMQGRPLSPLRAAMRYTRPPHFREYRRLVRIEPVFEQPMNYLVFRCKDLQGLMSGHHP